LFELRQSVRRPLLHVGRFLSIARAAARRAFDRSASSPIIVSALSPFSGAAYIVGQTIPSGELSMATPITLEIFTDYV